MKNLIRFLVMSVMLTFNNLSVASDIQTIPEYIDSISVKIETQEGVGSGFALTRKDSTGTNNVTFIWSVAHNFENSTLITRTNIIGTNTDGTILRFISHLPPEDNSPTLTYFDILQNVSKNGEIVDETNITVKLIKYSSSKKYDLALLQVDEDEDGFFNVNTTTFDLSGKIPKIGEKLYSLSCPDGMIGTFSEGVYSTVGRKIDDHLYDQTTCVIYPGSSGGGFFTTNGLCVGIADKFKAPGINLMIPIRVIHKWACENNIEWALDPSIPMPSTIELKKIPLCSDK